MNQLNTSPWRILLVKPRFERKAEKLLVKAEYNVYVPVQTQLRRWSDRLKKVDTLLFPGFVFVATDDKISVEAYKSEIMYGFMQRYEAGKKSPLVLKESDMAMIRRLTQLEAPVTILQQCPAPGDRVEIISGPLTGYTGEVTGILGSQRVLLSIPGLQCMAQVEMRPHQLRRI